MEEQEAIAVFTARSPERVIAEGGSQAWVLNPSRAKLAKWLVCTQNRHNPNHTFSDATEPHSSAFLVGKISTITETLEEGGAGRWIIEISEYARVALPGIWKGWRNPVRYTSLGELGIDVDGLEFHPVPRADDAHQPASEGENPPRQGLTISEAKAALALTFGVSPDAIEITIRG